MKITAELIRSLAPWFYRTDRRDDGLWHLLRDEATLYFANAIVIAAGASWTTPADMRTVAGNFLPTDAKGAIFWCRALSGVAGGTLFVAPGGAMPALPLYTKRVGRTTVANMYSLNSVCACLFGLTAGVPDGTLTFAARWQQITFLASVIGYIA